MAFVKGTSSSSETYSHKLVGVIEIVVTDCFTWWPLLETPQYGVFKSVVFSKLSLRLHHRDCFFYVVVITTFFEH